MVTCHIRKIFLQRRMDVSNKDAVFKHFKQFALSYSVPEKLLLFDIDDFLYRLKLKPRLVAILSELFVVTLFHYSYKCKV